MRFEDTCPKCGSHLIVRDGQFGEFLACPRFPQCKYTKTIHDGDELKEYKEPSPYCKKCNHTGLLPFIKNGKAISNVFLHCECRIELDNRDHYTPLKPEDYDFPMSETFQAWSHQYCGVQDPSYISRAGAKMQEVTNE